MQQACHTPATLPPSSQLTAPLPLPLPAPPRRQVVPQPDLLKARAIGDAMLFWFVVPWTMCAIIYTGLHCT